jgi:hypothetical protein
MKGQLKERWMSLCEQAAVEQDTQKLMVLIQEINHLLEEKEQRLHRRQIQLEENGAEGQQ